MTAVDNQHFTRVVVLAPQARVEAAAPADVALVELIPMLAAMVGERASDAEELRLSTVSGHQLDNALSLRDIGIADGQTLRLAPHGPPPPAPVFDDVVGVIAGHTALRVDRSSLAAVAGAATFVVTTLLASLLIPSVLGGAGAALALSVLAVATLAAAATLARQAPAGSLAAATAAVGAPAAFGAGVRLADPAQGSSGAMLATGAMLGGALAVGYCVLAALAARTGYVALSCLATVSGLTSVVGAAIQWWDVPPDRAAAGIAACAVAGLAILPWVAARVAGIPIPSGEGRQGWSGQRLATAQEQARVAVEVLQGTTMGSVAAAAVAAGCLGWHATGLELIFAVLVLAALALRMRATVHRASRGAMLAASLGGLVAMVGLHALSGGAVGVMLVALLALAWCGLGTMMLPRAYRPNPITTRAIDLAEAAVVIAMMPLAGWLTGLFTSVRHW